MTTLVMADVATIHSGGRLKLSGHHFVEQGVPAYGAGGQNGFLDTAEYEDREALILSSIGARCGKVFHVHGAWTSLANTQVILPDPAKVDGRFLWHQVNDELSWHRSGSAQPFIKPTDVKKRRIWVPPLHEQRRIASILDHADILRARRRAIADQLDCLAAATFRDMFANADSAPTALSALADVSSGITKGRRTSASTMPTPYLAVSNVQDGRLSMSAIKHIEATEAEIRRYALHHGDLVLTEGGDPDKLGRGTIWRSELPLCLHQNHIFRVRIHDCNAVLPEYLSAYMASRPARDYFRRAAKQTTGIASINMTQLKALPIPVPNVSMQFAFRDRVAAIARQLSATLVALELDASLVNSLRARAFRGEL